MEDKPKVSMKDEILSKIEASNSKLKVNFISALIMIEVECKRGHSLKIKPKDFLSLGECWCKECASITEKSIFSKIVEYMSLPYSTNVEYPLSSNVFYSYSTSLNEKSILFCIDEKIEITQTDKENTLLKINNAIINNAKIVVIDHETSLNREKLEKR